jgi:hypothetical protein
MLNFMSEQQITDDIACLLQWKDSTELRLEKIDKNIEEMKTNLIRRPTWVILAMISFLSTLSCGLIVEILNLLSKIK